METHIFLYSKTRTLMLNVLYEYGLKHEICLPLICPHKKSIFFNFNNYYMILHGELIITYKGLSFVFFFVD